MEKPYHFFNSGWGRLLLTLVIIIGIFFRFINIDKKIYWSDEIFSSLRIAGFSVEEVRKDIYTGREVTVKELQSYQFPSSNKRFADVLDALKTHPEHSPLYYLMARGLVQRFGYSVAVMRSLAAWISLLALPAVYWLCLELFESSMVGCVALALFSVSPFQVLYAQEARQYSLFIVTLLLSSAALLRGIRLHTKQGINLSTITAWGLYSLTVTFGLYSHLLFFLVCIAHGLYLLVRQNLRWNKTWMAYIFSSVLAGILFSPWIWVFVTNFHKAKRATLWMYHSMSLPLIMANWAGNLTKILLDFNLNKESKIQHLMIAVVPWLAIIFLYIYALYFLVKQTPIKVWSFIIILIGVTALSLIIPDLIVGGRRSTVPRYLISCYVGIHLTVSYLLGNRITAINITAQGRKLWQGITMAVITSGIISCLVISQAEIWWTKGSENFAAIARIINQSNQPVVLSDTPHVSNVIALSYYLDTTVKIQLSDGLKIPLISPGYDRIFLYDPSPKLRSLIEQENAYKIKPISESSDEVNNLWILTDH